MKSIKVVANVKVYLDDHWQTPVITEKKVRELIDSNKVLASFDNYRNHNVFVDYYAIPWATYIDVMTQNAKPELRTKFQDVISEIQSSPSTSEHSFTVCQHIYFKKIIPILKRAGIKILFASHAQKDTYQIDGVIIKSFPLYPINGVTTSDSKDLLYSFVGAYNPSVYMSPIRKNLYQMNHPESAIVISTGQWHFEKHVYQEQMRGILMNEQDLNMLDNNKREFQSILSRSRYSLCPSGSGPNSIRLWESMQAGAIPILLSDKLRLPRENKISWNYAMLIVPESDYLQIPDLLSQIPKNVEDQMRSNCLELFDKLCGDGGCNMDKLIRMSFNDLSDTFYTMESNNVRMHNQDVLLSIDDLEMRNLTIFTSHKRELSECPKMLRENLTQWKMLNGGYCFKYYSDEDMHEWMLRHTNKVTFDNFSSLNSGAGKADMFRICKLLHDGGIWVDADLPAFDIDKSKSNFRQLIHSNGTVLIRNRKCDNPRYTIMASKRNSDLLYHQMNAINNRIVEAKKSNSQNLEGSTIGITGPFVLHKLLCTIQKLDKIENLPLNKKLNINTSSFIYIDDIVPEKENYELENTYSGYRNDLMEMGVQPHSTIKAIK